MELTGVQDNFAYSGKYGTVCNVNFGNYLAAQTPEYYIACMDPKSCEIYHMCSNCNCRADIAIY